MKEFALLFRQPGPPPSDATAEEIQAAAKKWQDWFAGIAAQGKLASQGNRLAPEGKVLKAGGLVTDGPFVEIRERLGGFIIVRADSLDDATTLAHGCPAIVTGGSVEIRQVNA